MGNDKLCDWLNDLAQGDSRAAEQLWQRYFAELGRMAQRRLAGIPRRAFDEEDVALSALNSFIDGVRAGRFPRLNDETDLRRLLVMITFRKANAQRRRHFALRRNRGAVRGESVFREAGAVDQGMGIAAVPGLMPTPEFAAQVAEQCQALFEILKDPLLRDIARWKIEGHSNDEIAERIGRNVRTVERKLSLIRDCWSGSNDAPIKLRRKER